MLNNLMAQSTEQSIAALQKEVARLDKLTKNLFLELQRVQKENLRLKHAIGRVERDGKRVEQDVGTIRRAVSRG